MEHTLSLSEKEFQTLRDMILTYKEFEEELYDYPPEDTLFTETQRNLFQRLKVYE